MNYRPLQSLTMWAFGHISRAHLYFWIRVMHFIGMEAYATALFLWLAKMPIGRFGVVIAAAVFFLHPTFPAPLASIDGLASLYSSAALWLGALAVMKFPNSLLGLILVILAFVVGAGYKEYILGLGPLASLTAVMFVRHRRWRWVLQVGTTLTIALVGLLVVRHFTIPPGLSGVPYVCLQPKQWLVNAAILGTGLLFFGDSVWVFFHQTHAVLAAVAGSMVLISLVLARGILLRVRRDSSIASPADGDPTSPSRALAPQRRCRRTPRLPNG